MLKDDAEHPIPETWRASLRQIAGAFVAADFELREHQVAGVASVDPGTAKEIAENITAYGERLAPLNDATWDGSVYRWMDGYWLMLVDLTTEAAPVSDLTLHAKLHDAEGAELEIESVHVP
jgi:hypothetical protein